MHPATTTAAASDAQMLRLGLWVSLTNPKAILFFGALFPQFVSTDRPLLPQFTLLVSLSMAASVSCLLTYVWLASRARRWLQRPRAALWINRVAGSVFIGWLSTRVGSMRVMRCASRLKTVTRPSAFTAMTPLTRLSRRMSL